MAGVPHDLKCPLCRILYKDPYSLKSCGHHVCLPCLQSLVSPVCCSGEDRVKFECPFDDCESITFLSVTAIGNRVEIDFEASDEIIANPTLGRITQSFTQLEEQLERERVERVEKERTIKELQNGRQSVDGSYDTCKKHESQGMELNLYCIQCDVFLCHLCANKPHHKHGVIAASCKDEYQKNKGKIIESIRNAERCVDFIGSELKSQFAIVKRFEDKIAPVAQRMNKTKIQINGAIKILQDFYEKLEDKMEVVRLKVKEPMVDASNLLKDIVSEITSARTILENGFVRQFEKSNTRLALLQGMKIKDSNDNINSDVQHVVSELDLLEKIGDNIKRYVERSLDLNGSQNAAYNAVTLEDNEMSLPNSPNYGFPGMGASGSGADNRDLDGALACNHSDIQKRAYITSLGLDPREIAPPPVETVDTGVQKDGVEMSDSSIQVTPDEIEGETSKDMASGRGVKRTADSALETSVDKNPRLSTNDTFTTAVDESMNISESLMDNTVVEDGTSDNENGDETFDYRHLSFDSKDVVTGRFVIVSHDDEREFPWIGKIKNSMKKNVRVMWYKGQLNEHWCVDSKYLELLDKATIHASFECEEDGSQFLMERGLSHEIEHLMSTL